MTFELNTVFVYGSMPPLMRPHSWTTNGSLKVARMLVPSCSVAVTTAGNVVMVAEVVFASKPVHVTSGMGKFVTTEMIYGRSASLR